MLRLMMNLGMTDIARGSAATKELGRSHGHRKGSAPLAGAEPMTHQPEPPPIAARVLRTARAADVLGSLTRFPLRRGDGHARLSLYVQSPQTATVVSATRT